MARPRVSNGTARAKVMPQGVVMRAIPAGRRAHARMTVNPVLTPAWPKYLYFILETGYGHTAPAGLNPTKLAGPAQALILLIYADLCTSSTKLALWPPSWSRLLHRFGQEVREVHLRKTGS